MKVISLRFVIMAAGIGSRFGGLKQLARPEKERRAYSLNFSLYDAIEAGFKKGSLYYQEGNRRRFSNF